MAKIGVINSDLECEEIKRPVEMSDRNSSVRKRIPKRILHFSDGTLEEYSDDELDDAVDCAPVAEQQVAVVDPATLPWGRWLFYQSLQVGSSVLKVCDYLGETLANFFGIVTPKYQYEIEHYKRMLVHEQERQAKSNLVEGGWSPSADQPTVQVQPSSSVVGEGSPTTQVTS